MVDKKRFRIPIKQFSDSFSFYFFAVLIIAFVVSMIIFRVSVESLVILTVALFMIYFIYTLKSFKIIVKDGKVFIPKSPLMKKDAVISSNIFFYKSNLSEWGEDLEYPYFFFEKSNIKSVNIVTDKKELENSDKTFPSMFYVSEKEKTVCIEFKNPLIFQKIDEDTEVDENLNNIEKIYVSVTRPNEFVQDLKKI